MEVWKKLRETDWWENANEKEKGKYKIHKYKIHKVKIQTTRYKIQRKRVWRRTESRGGEGGGRWRYCDSDDRYYAQGGEGKGR